MSLNRKALVASLLFLLLVPLFIWGTSSTDSSAQEAGEEETRIAAPTTSKTCVACHVQSQPGIVEQWRDSPHAKAEIGCLECHQADVADADAFRHNGRVIATVVTPRDCATCHEQASAEFQGSHHAKAGNILASLDNYLAEVVEGAAMPFEPHSDTPGLAVDRVQGDAVVNMGCAACHGSLVALRATDGGTITREDLQPDENGRPTNAEAVGRILKNAEGRPIYDYGSWPNTGIGRLNLDGSLGACSACHSRHDFSPRRARQPENCGKCHLGPDHPQKEAYEESKHNIAYRDLKDEMNLDGETWVLGKDYTQAPTCATCHMSGHSRNGGRVTHDAGARISWTNRPPVSALLDTDINGVRVTEADPAVRQKLVTDTWQQKRDRMQDVCLHCHTTDYVDGFYEQYDDLIVLYNEKFAKPGVAIMKALREQKLLTPKEFDEEIEWTWFLLWHHEGRRARHGASKGAPDYVHWHGMMEVAERFYEHLIPQARAAAKRGSSRSRAAVDRVIDEILARPEHAWFEGK